MGYLTVALSNQGQITFLPGILGPQAGLEFPYHKEVIPGCLLFVRSETSLLPSRVEASLSRARGSHHLPFWERGQSHTGLCTIPLGEPESPWPFPFPAMALATQTGPLWNNLLFSVTSLYSHREVLGSLSLKQDPEPLGFVCVCLYFFQPCHVACGILVPQPGIDLSQGLQWKHRVLMTARQVLDPLILKS